MYVRIHIVCVCLCMFMYCTRRVVLFGKGILYHISVRNSTSIYIYISAPYLILHIHTYCISANHVHIISVISSLVGGLEHFLFSIIYDGMSSFPLTNSIIFQDCYAKPPTRSHIRYICISLVDTSYLMDI